MAFIPLAVALAFGIVRIVFVAYRELTSPLDTSTPIVLRVLGETPEVIVAVVLAWMVGEMIGAWPRGASSWPATASGRRSAPRSRLPSASALGPDPLLAADRRPVRRRVAGGGGGGVGLVGGRRRPGGSGEPTAVLVDVVAFVVVWLVGLALIAVVCAWRAAVWTVAEVARKGTFGGSTDRRPGDWRADRSSATL